MEIAELLLNFFTVTIWPLTVVFSVLIINREIRKTTNERDKSYKEYFTKRDVILNQWVEKELIPLLDKRYNY